jgi:hypothetical protein
MTRTRLALLAVVLWPVTSFAADVPKLIEQLADPDYATREAATKKLCDLGAPALAALRTAAESGTPERAERAAALVVRITRRIENEQALAPTVVELPATEQTVREVFDAIEKQSRVQLRINGDQAILTQKLTPAGGKKPFWACVQGLVTKVGLEVTWVQNGRAELLVDINSRDALLLLQWERKDLATSLNTLTRMEEEQKQKLKTETDPKRMAVIRKEIEEIAADVKQVKQATMKVEAQILDHQKRPPLLGVVILKASAKPNPAYTCGAVRVEAAKASADVLKRYTPGHLPLAVKVFAEPKLEWYRVSETVVFEAVGPDGQPVAAESFTPKAFSTLANDELQFRRARLGLRDGETEFAPSTAGTATLAAPASGKPLTLKSVRGVVRGTVWTAPGEVVAVGLDEKDVTVATSANATLRTKVLPPTGFNNDQTPRVEVTLQFDPTAVRPQVLRSATDDTLWLENGPGGRVVPRPARAEARRFTADQHGLLFADADGKPLDMAPQSATSYQLLQDGRYMTVVCRTFAVRNTPANDGRTVAKVSFHGTQQKQVSVPFTLTDVTLTPGTGDGQPLPEDYDIRSKR